MSHWFFSLPHCYALYCLTNECHSCVSLHVQLAEAEDRSNQLERRILLLEKECRHLKSNGSSPVGSIDFTGASSTTSGLGSSITASKLVHSNHFMANDQSTRRLIDELNHKVKNLEEDLDHRLQLYEDLEMKYEKQKVKQHETLWKLRWVVIVIHLISPI